ncbi:Protein phosphatase 1 regulatory subunit 3B [Trichoplax sp. H2]|nr:Protein phosphatase 1 regulatory subunit 3B [Trichoplax sp. H2]|eukprot:RDD37511.1 Protein phosphatase 1 regulatory subunit 3B [Trichoplax sp. H2]
MIYSDSNSHSRLPMERTNPTDVQMPMQFNLVSNLTKRNTADAILPFGQLNDLVDCFTQASLTSSNDDQLPMRTSASLEHNLLSTTVDNNFQAEKTLRQCHSDNDIRPRKPKVKKPFHKKSVRFADSLGMQLVTIYELSSQSVVAESNNNSKASPTDATKNLASNQHQHRQTNCCTEIRKVNLFDFKCTIVDQAMNRNYCKLNKTLKLCFDQPAQDNNFTSNLKKNFIQLEKVTLKEQLRVIGDVKVRNIAYEKAVTVRYTLDSWKTCNDMAAQYKCSSENGIVDTFSFTLTLPTNLFVEKLEFAIKYDCNSTSYWDNNNNHNYVIKVISVKDESDSRLNSSGMALLNHRMSHHFL